MTCVSMWNAFTFMLEPLSSGASLVKELLLKWNSNLSRLAFIWELFSSCCFMKLSKVLLIPSTSTAVANWVGDPSPSTFTIVEALVNSVQAVALPNTIHKQVYRRQRCEIGLGISRKNLSCNPSQEHLTPSPPQTQRRSAPGILHRDTTLQPSPILNQLQSFGGKNRLFSTDPGGRVGF